MKKKVAIISSIVIVIICIILYLFLGLRSVSKESVQVKFNVRAGENKVKIISNLKSAGLIRSRASALAYVFLNPKLNLQAGTYTLDKSMDTKQIIKNINDGKIDEIVATKKITFVEGRRITDYLKQIEVNFGIKYDDMIKKLKDENFLDELINKYDFLTSEIKNKSIYYSLEGYFYPDTYEFYENTSFENIINVVLNNLNQKLSTVSNLSGSKYSVHEILTMASIIEQEAVTTDDRAKVSQVIYKRLDNNMSLGMDVTAYYGVQKSLKEPITQGDLNSSNPYNTRLTSFIGLPVGPICNPSIISINVALNPASTNYEYFYADITTGKVYFSEDAQGFYEIQEKLKLGDK